MWYKQHGTYVYAEYCFDVVLAVSLDEAMAHQGL